MHASADKKAHSSTTLSQTGEQTAAGNPLTETSCPGQA